MDMLLDQTVIFAFMLTVALLVERIVEILKSIYDFVDCNTGMAAYWTRKAEVLQVKLEHAFLSLEKGNYNKIGMLVKQYADVQVDGVKDGVVTISGDLLRATTVRFAAKIIAIILGVMFCMSFELDIIAAWQEAAELKQVNSGFSLGDTSRKIITGAMVGLGAGPLHKIITTIERSEKKRKSEK